MSRTRVPGHAEAGTISGFILRASGSREEDRIQESLYVQRTIVGTQLSVCRKLVGVVRKNLAQLQHMLDLSVCRSHSVIDYLSTTTTTIATNFQPSPTANTKVKVRF
jgi:hypothetical protein